MVTARSSAGAVLRSIQLDFALSQGNTTGGTDLICTSGDRILGEDGATGGALTFIAGTSSGAGAGGALLLTSGDSASGSAGDITLTTGSSAGGNSGSLSVAIGTAGVDGGDILMEAGDAPGDPGNITLIAGEHTGADGAVTGGLIQLIPGNGDGLGGGTTIIRSGYSSASGIDGNIYIAGATATASTTPAGEIVIITSPGTDRGGSSITLAQSTGQITLLSGSATGSNLNGSPIVLATGVGDGSGDGGNFTFTASPGGPTGNGGDFNITAGSGGATSGNGGNITVTPGFATAGNRGTLIINGDTDASGTVESEGLILDETSTVPESPTGTTQGVLWVRDDNPNVLIFTDNAGTDTVLGSGGALATVLGVGNVTGGTDIVMTTGDSIVGEDAASGGDVTLIGGVSTGTNTGGDVVLTGGSVTGGSSENAGGVIISGGVAANASGDGGAILISGGAGSGFNTSCAGGSVTIQGGDPSSSVGQGGGITLHSGDAYGAFSCRNIELIGGDSDGQTGSNIMLTSGAGEVGGYVELKGGTQTSTGGGAQTGSIIIESGDIDTGVNGTIGDIFIRTPDGTSTLNHGAGDIHISAGQNGLRNHNGGSVNISAGDTYGGSNSFGGGITLICGDEQGNGTGTINEGGSLVMSPGNSVASGFEGVARIEGSGTLEIQERAAAITSPFAGGEGRVWVRSDTPNTLMFTDDAGTDYAIAGSSVSTSVNLAGVLTAGSDTGGSAITTADSAVATPNVLSLEAGDHTGAVAGQDGSTISLIAGDTNSTTGTSGSVILNAGDSTAGGGYGGVQLATQSDEGPITMLTHTSADFAAYTARTYHQTISLAPLTTTTLITIATLDTFGQSILVDIAAQAHDSTSFGAITAYKKIQAYTYSGVGLASVTANLNSQQSFGIYSDIVFDISPSGPNDIVLTIENTHASTTFNPTVTFTLITQRGGVA